MNNGTRADYLLEKKKVDPNAQDNDGNTPLHLAAAFGRLEIIELLKSNGVDPEELTALKLAAAYGSREVIWELLKGNGQSDLKVDGEMLMKPLAAAVSSYP